MSKISLPPDCSLRSAKAVHADLSAALVGGQDIAIDCSALATCDLTGVQILVSAMRTAQDAGRSVRLTGELTALAAVLARAGLALSPAGDRILIGEA